jgi:hypothetical protein
MGHSLTTNDYILGLGQDICDGFNKNFKNPTIHKVPGQPDVYLISKEGVRVKVHKVSDNFHIWKLLYLLLPTLNDPQSILRSKSPPRNPCRVLVLESKVGKSHEEFIFLSQKPYFNQELEYLMQFKST